jgi:hypothetical protein
MKQNYAGISCPVKHYIKRNVELLGKIKRKFFTQQLKDTIKT